MANTIEIPIELLERLAPSEAMNQDEQGGCVWCGWSEGMMYFAKGKRNKGSLYADERPETHTPDCPWVQARAHLTKRTPDALRAAALFGRVTTAKRR